MKVLLVGPDFEENLSLRYLASSLEKRGHQVQYAAFNTAEDDRAVARAADEADLVGLSMCFQARAREYLALARLLKQRRSELPIVAGGHYASCAAEPLLANHPEIDVVVLHEGERTLADIANAGAELAALLPSLPGVAFRDGPSVRMSRPRPILADLDELPVPDRSGPVRRQAGVPIAYILGSRGCLGSCAYCCITTLHRLAPGKCFRQRAPERVADEMADLYHERGVRQFVFHDDNFLVPSARHNHARLQALAGALARRGVGRIGLVIKCRPQDADASVFRRLRDMGLLRVFFGIETATEEGLRCLNRTHSIAQAERALALCAELGISAQYTIMTFHPEATLATIRADIAFMRRHIDFASNFCRAEIYAGTPLEQRMLAEGRTRGDYLARSYTLADPSADRLCEAWKRFLRGRCGNVRGLMNEAIGLDYRIAVLDHLCDRSAAAALSALSAEVRAWCREVRGDSLDRLEELARLCEEPPALDPALEEFGARERRSRATLEGRGMELAQKIAAFAERAPVQPAWRPLQPCKTSTPQPRAQKAAALVLAGLAAAACEGCQSEMGAASLDAPYYYYPQYDSSRDLDAPDGRSDADTGPDGGDADAGADAAADASPDVVAPVDGAPDTGA